MIEYFKTTFSYFYLPRRSINAGVAISFRSEIIAPSMDRSTYTERKYNTGGQKKLVKVAPLRSYEIMYGSPFDRIQSRISTPITNVYRVLFHISQNPIDDLYCALSTHTREQIGYDSGGFRCRIFTISITLWRARFNFFFCAHNIFSCIFIITSLLFSRS